MTQSTPLLKPREAATLLGISYPTIKQWILSGKLKTVQTPGGHHRLTVAALKPFIAKDKERTPEESRERYRRVSGRNQLVGRVIDVRIDGLFAQIVLEMSDGQRINSIITAEAVRELQLKRGELAAALIKSTDVMIERMEFE